MKYWEVQMRDLISQTNSVREALEHVLTKISKDSVGSKQLAFDLSEFYGACRVFIEEIEALRDEMEAEPSLLGVELAKLEANLEDAQLHLRDSLRSVRAFHRRLSGM